MNRLYYTAAAAMLGVALAATPPADAQNRWSAFAVDGNWGNDSNWDIGFAPDPAFDSAAIVGAEVLGAATSANVTVNGAFNAPTVQIANGGGTNATVTIPATRSLTTVTDLSAGDLDIGLGGGTGVLNVAGTLNVARVLSTPTAGNFNSALNLSGSAVVTARNAFLDRQLRIVGPSVSFTTTGVDAAGNGVILGGGGVHTWEFGASGPSKLKVNGGNLDLGGTLKLVTPGYTPTVGSSWVLADSGSVDSFDASPSGFGLIDATGVPNLQPGAAFVVNSAPGGVNGVLTTLALQQHPVLTVNRQTGVASLKNFSGTASTIAFDAYTVRSALGGLSTAGFNGLDDKGTSGDTWFEANPTATGISELNPTTTLALSGGQSISLGSAFAPPAPASFGDENEDIAFQFGTPDGSVLTGQVVYEGMPNNTLVLNVDPSTGIASILNPSSFNVGIDAYVISSASGGLSTTAWSSLDDQNVGGVNQWFEANPSATQLSELLVDGSLALGANQSDVYDIGTPWATTGQRDLTFRFALEGETSLRTGKVVYAALAAPSLPGDANGDGKVDLLDLDILGANFGAMGATLAQGDFNSDTKVDLLDLDILGANFGAMAGTATATAVPEPAGLVLAGVLGSLAALRRRV